MINKNKSLYTYLILDTLFFLLCIAGIYHITQKAALPLQLEKRNNKLIVINNKEGGNSVTVNDTIINVNKYVVHDIEEIECIIDGIAIGRDVDVLLKRDNTEIDLQIKTIPYYKTEYIFIASFVSLFFFIVGIFVLLRKPNLTSAKLFHNGAISTAIIIATTWGNYNIEPQGLGQGIRILFSAAYSFAPMFFVDFVLSLRQREGKGYGLLRAFLYSLSSIFFLLQAITFINFINSKTITSIDLYLNVFSLFRVYLIVYLIIGLSIFIFTYNSTVEEYERKKLRWILFGFSVGVTGLLILWIIPYLITSKGLVSEDLLLLIVLVIPVTFAISIVRYRWLDIDLIIKRSIIYAMVVALLLLTYTFMIVFITGLLKIENTKIPAFITVILIALFFQPVYLRLQAFVNKKFFRIHFNLKEILTEFIEDIKNVNDSKSLTNKINEIINKAIPVEKIIVFTFNSIEEEIDNISHNNYNGIIKDINKLKNDFKKISKISQPIAKRSSCEPGAMIDLVDSDIIPIYDFEIAIPIKGKTNNLLGIIFLGKKKSQTRYTIEDIDLLLALSSSVREAIEKIELQDELLKERMETERLEELNKIKSLFVSTVSHDLKTPLTSIKMFAEMLQSNPNIPSKKKLEYLKIIEGESDRLTRLIDSVLDYAKIEKGIKEYRFENVNINNIIQEVLKLMEYSLTIQKFNVRTNLVKKEHLIYADKDAITEALLNLISNSIKYSEEKREINITTYTVGNYFALSVEDKGIGIKEDELNKILIPYFRSEETVIKKKEGTGLGLTIIKHIMNAHNGEIKIESRRGEGSKFTLLFPLGEKDE